LHIHNSFLERPFLLKTETVSDSSLFFFLKVATGLINTIIIVSIALLIRELQIMYGILPYEVLDFTRRWFYSIISMALDGNLIFLTVFACHSIAHIDKLMTITFISLVLLAVFNPFVSYFKGFRD
jgi:hypothetical protein